MGDLVGRVTDYQGSAIAFAVWFAFKYKSPVILNGKTDGNKTEKCEELGINDDVSYKERFFEKNFHDCPQLNIMKIEYQLLYQKNRSRARKGGDRLRLGADTMMFNGIIPEDVGAALAAIRWQ